jgi:predicted dithiol-disulfide oxidoreductase (DUF899 family)
MTEHEVVGREEWQAARQKLLQREKQHTRLGDELARQRRELPWVAIHKQVPVRRRRRNAHPGGAV